MRAARAQAVAVGWTSRSRIRPGLVDRTAREFGRIDILVNDAAYNKWIPFAQLQDLQMEDWTKILEVNLTGPFCLQQSGGADHKRQGRGRIVNVSSLAGLSPTGRRSPTPSPRQP